MRRWRFELVGMAVLITALCTAWGCTSEVPEGTLTEGVGAPPGTTPSEGSTSAAPLEVTFLATSGFLVRSGADALLTDPFFSNPGILDLLSPGCLVPDPERIDPLMPPKERTADVRAVLIGQGHHDHLMDLPYVVPEHAPEAVIYGSRTVGHLMAPFELASVAANGSAASAGSMGEWLPVEGAAMRILPLVSEHAPQIMGMNLVTGTLEEDPEEKPCAAWEWLQGEAFAFVVDWLDADGSVRFRVHFQDSATGVPYAFHPAELLDDGVPVDVALLPVASFAQVERYPEALVEHLQPRHVVLHHWDDFMVDPREEPVVLRGQDLPEFVRRLEAGLPEGSDWQAPNRGATLRFDRAPRD